MKEKELLELKQEIDHAKEESLKLQGQKNALLQQLKDEYQCSSVEQAEKLLERLQGEYSKLTSEIEEGIKKVEKEYFAEDEDE
jgi:predicted transcriptional regulator